jgi:flagellar biosynthetic protein FlhB
LGINIYHVGFFIASKPLIPDFKRMNPISGMKKIVSLRSLVELSKGIIKAGLLLLMVYTALRNELEAMSHAIAFPLVQGVPLVVETIWWLALKMALLLLMLGVFDYAYQRWEFERSIRMSKKEIKDEYKQMEGDPKIKQKIRQRQREMAQRRMMSEVPKADVVVTNPTTYAVALQYNREIMDAPVVLAKGRGAIARRIREIAEEHNIPIVENPPLARSLYDMAEIGFEIPESFYKTVAEVLAFVYKMRKK